MVIISSTALFCLLLFDGFISGSYQNFYWYYNYMSKNNLPVSVDEARNILGSDATGMSDEEITDVITTLDIMAKDALEVAQTKLRMKRDAKDLANLIYDIYQDKKSLEDGKQQVSGDVTWHKVAETRTKYASFH